MDIFKTINKLNPEMFVWLGDAAYLDNLDIDYLQEKYLFLVELNQKKDLMKHSLMNIMLN